MKQLIALETNTLQTFIDNPASITTEDISLQIAVASHPDTPRNLLEILANSDIPEVAEAAQLHVNYAGELSGNWQDTVDEKLKSRYLGQNDRLAVELLKIAPVTPYFLSEYVPANYLIQGLSNPHLPLRYRLQLLARLGQESTLEPRLQVAESPETPLPVLEQLIGDLELSIRIAVQYNPKCPPELVKLVTGQHDVASNWDTDSQQLENLSNSNWDWIRLAVAQNPSASEETLLKLAGDKVFKIQLAVAKNPATSARVLSVLAEHSSKEIQGSVAKHLNATEEILHSLFDTQQRVIKDRKNLPASILEKIFNESPKDSQIPLFLSRYGIGISFFIRQPNTPTWIAEVAGNKDTPIGVLRRLAYDSSTEVCRRLTRNQNTPVEVLEFLGVKKGIVNVYNANTPEKALAAAVEKALNIKHGYQELPGLYRQNKGRDKALDALLKSRTSKVPARILEQLASNYPTSWVRSSIAHHHNTPASALEKMIDDNYGPVLWGISRNPNATPEILEKLVNHPNLSDQDIQQIYPSIAGRSDISANLIEKLLKSNLYRVRENVVSKPNLPLEIAERLIKEESKESVLVSLARNPILTTELLTKFIKNPNIAVCQTLINHPNLTLEHWQELVRHSESTVRKTLASKSNAPVNILESLSQDKVTDVRIAVAGNSNTSNQVLEQLSQDAEATVRTKVATNTNTPINILENLAKDESVEVRRAVANNPNVSESIKELLTEFLPAAKTNTQQLSPTLRGLSRIYKPETDDLPTLLSEYVNSDVAFVRFISLLHPLTPIEILTNNANSVSWIERYAVADNPNTPTEIKQQLTQDSNQIVRAVAIDKLAS